MASRNILVFFFFQAEDGIRDYKVTGVQTCALPISSEQKASPDWRGLLALRRRASLGEPYQHETGGGGGPKKGLFGPGVGGGPLLPPLEKEGRKRPEEEKHPPPRPPGRQLAPPPSGP